MGWNHFKSGLGTLSFSQPSSRHDGSLAFMALSAFIAFHGLHGVNRLLCLGRSTKPSKVSPGCWPQQWCSKSPLGRMRCSDWTGSFKSNEMSMKIAKASSWPNRLHRSRSCPPRFVKITLTSWSLIAKTSKPKVWDAIENLEKVL